MTEANAGEREMEAEGLAPGTQDERGNAASSANAKAPEAEVPQVSDGQLAQAGEVIDSRLGVIAPPDPLADYFDLLMFV